MSWIMTYSGIKFDLLDPKVWQVKLKDIAHALSMNCRYTGHTIFFYSVAQHSLLGAYKMILDGRSNRLQLLFMLHDATETWYNDISRPLKPLLTNYIEMEDKASMVVWEAFGIEPPTDEEWAIVKYYDNLMLYNEIPKLMNNPEEFECELRDDDIEIEELKISEVEEMFTLVIIELLRKVVIDYEDKVVEEFA